MNTFLLPTRALKGLLASVFLVLLLPGCQTTMQKIADCKAGDWSSIGHKDGHAGLISNFGERKAFCSSYAKGADKTDSEVNYQSGWAQGNWDLWSETGRSDGRKALPLTRIETHVTNIEKNRAQVNRPAYEAGWRVGNSAYWQDAGLRAGSIGLSLAQRETSRADAVTLQIVFDEGAYASGWKTGNTAYWQAAGFQDANSGIPDSSLVSRAKAARAVGVLVQEGVYRAAWNAEIINYWKNLGTQDAISGKDFVMRSSEARKKGLKVLEAEYRQSWEARLANYWTEVGDRDGYGHPFGLEERMARASYDQVFVIANTRELYTRAWDRQNARYCNVDDAFVHGRRHEPMAIEVCKSSLQGQLRRAYLSGQDYEMIAEKHAHDLAEISEYTRKIADTRRRLEQLDRVIHSNLGNKQRVVDADTARQDKRREEERKALDEQIDHAGHELDDARRWEDLHHQQMLKLKRDIY